MDQDFVQHVMAFVELSIQHLTCKKIYWKEIVVGSLPLLLAKYVNLFHCSTLEIKSLCHVQAELCHTLVIKKTVKYYVAMMWAKYPPNTKEFVDDTILEMYVEEASRMAQELYNKEKKLGDTLYSETYGLKLEGVKAMLHLY